MKFIVPIQSSHLLNQLTGTQNFPQLDNELIPFLREKEHDTKVRLVQPIFQSAIFSNNTIKGELKKSSYEEVSHYKQELIKEIRTAYYQFIQASRLTDLYKGTIELVNETSVGASYMRRLTGRCIVLPSHPLT